MAPRRPAAGGARRPSRKPRSAPDRVRPGVAQPESQYGRAG
eukprot:SAG25_NODE_10097_length_346_cov_0.623482_1_plen_40_part_10